MEYHPSGGTQQSFVQEGSVPKVPPERKGTPFVGLLNGTPFTYLVQNFASLFTHCCKYTVF